MKTVYICHPLSENAKKNKAKIIDILKNINQNHPDIIPVAPYLTNLVVFLEENQAESHPNHYVYFQRGFIDQLWVYGDALTPNMKTEIEWAKKHRVNIKYLSKKMQLLPQKSEEDFLNRLALIVCKEMRVKPTYLKADSRRRNYALCRQMFASIAYKTAVYNIGRTINLVTIGHYLNRHYSTIIHAINTVEDLCETDKFIKQSYMNIINKI